MTDASERGTATSTSTRRASARRWFSWLQHPLTGRILAGAGAALFLCAAWLPWQALYLAATGILMPTVVWRSPISLDGSPFPGLSGDADTRLVVWSALSVLGPLLAALLWQRGGVTRTRVTLGAYALWALLASVASVTIPLSLAHAAMPVSVACVESARACAVVSASPALYGGAWAALAALALALAGTIPLARGELRAHGSAAGAVLARYPVAQPRWRGAGWLTAGMILWAAGYLVVPWASFNCGGTPLFVGTCLGVSGSAATQSGIQSAATVFDPLFARYAAVFLLGGGGVLLLGGLWLRVSAVALRVWGWLWVLAAVAIAITADNGVGAIIAQPASFALPVGTWRGALGLPLTFVALLVAAVGLVLLEVSAFRQRRVAS